MCPCSFILLSIPTEPPLIEMHGDSSVDFKETPTEDTQADGPAQPLTQGSGAVQPSAPPMTELQGGGAVQPSAPLIKEVQEGGAVQTSVPPMTEMQGVVPYNPRWTPR